MVAREALMTQFDFLKHKTSYLGNAFAKIDRIGKQKIENGFVELIKTIEHLKFVLSDVNEI